jgi:hypothetical protein
MNNHTLHQRLMAAAENYNFYLMVGDHSLAEQSRQDWVYYNQLIEGERHVA